MQYDIITIFPKILDSYFNESILKRAQKAKLITIKTHDLRAYTTDKHHKVDDSPYGGGPGMIFKIEPLYKCLKALKRKKKSKVFLMDPAGQQFNQKMSASFAKLDQIILICGRYEGVDARIDKLIDGKICIGPYVLSGGELPAAIIVEAVSRLLPGVLGKMESLQYETFNGELSDVVEHPQYTKPAVFNRWKVPEILLSGNHAEIDKWRKGKKRS
ncbi:MAG: tRNA (guanosine(37)-N1)-methyltransferase TrmD [Candidatus Komeilibacteria bacterium]|nr:tRNA (guanosine(37)-N1)-methyltransferase TrmD [Candidatus Komeilibacteria bacterium]